MNCPACNAAPKPTTLLGEKFSFVCGTWVKYDGEFFQSTKCKEAERESDPSPS